MAILGIDFGTTNSVVAVYDRGSYPVVPHSVQTQIGRVNHEVYPSFIYYDLDEKAFSYGLDAERKEHVLPKERGIAVRSLKRALAAFKEGSSLDTPVRFHIKELLVNFLESLRTSLEGSGFFAPGETFDCVISWPAHANGAQRAVTREAFRAAGFNVVGSLNEPTASAIEYADRVTGGNPRAARKLTDSIAVFDLGGGTFDASLLSIDRGRFRVLDSLGLEDLGGDDLDGVLMEMFARKLKLDLDTLDHNQLQWFRQHARTQKETIGNQGAKSLMLDPEDLGLDGRPISIRTGDFVRQIKPLVNRAVDRLEELLGRDAAVASHADRPLGAIYLVGGSSRLPLVEKLITQRFKGVKVISTHKPFTSVAVGAAIYASQKMEVADIFSRHFGVYRLLDDGTRDVFDPIFPAGTPLPAKGAPPLVRTVEYRPHHNIGHLRFLECTDVDPTGLPSGSVRSWSDVLFPYDPGLSVETRMDPDRITPEPQLAGTVVRESYRCDADGVITVEMDRQVDGQRRCFELYHE